jgi:hypothetical protein
MSVAANLFGVQPNYLKTSMSDFLKIENKSSSALDVVEELYASSDKIKVIITKV